MQVFIGIDPGVHGAVALLSPDGSVSVHDTPVIVVDGAKRKQTKMNGPMCAEILRRIKDAYGIEAVTVILEQPNAMIGSKWGSFQNFTLGRSLGVWEGIVAGIGFRLETVSPQRWKKSLQLPADKDQARLKATQWFPAAAHSLARKKDDGRAEALLLAEYGRRLFRPL